MFDLNLSVDCNGKADHSKGQLQSPATSVSSVVDGGGETSSSNEDAYGDAAAVTLNFDIVGDRHRHAGLVTRELFPVSRLGERQISDPGSLQFDHNPSGMPVQQPQQLVQQVQARKSRRGPRSRSSQYRGVTFYRRTGRWESHIWDCGKQVYLGGFDTALAAARAYDRAAIKFRGVDADINFNLSDYDEDMKQTKNLSKEEFVHILRRNSTGFSRGTSKYRGVTLHKCGRWEARMGQFLGKKAYDKAAIKCNGREAVTNFESSSYDGEMISSESQSGNVLDLNLGMSTSSPKESGSSGCYQFNPYNDVQNACMFKAHVESRSVATRLGNPATPGTCGLNPKVSQESSSSEQLVQWAWRMHRPTPVTTAAASSGFSISSSPATTSLNLCFSSNPSPANHSQITSSSPRH